MPDCRLCPAGTVALHLASALVVEADGNRTRQRRGTPLSGFEDQRQLGDCAVSLRSAVVCPGRIVNTSKKGFPVGWFPSLTQEALALTPVDFVDTAGHNGKTGFFCLSYLAASALGHPLPDSTQVTQVIQHICEMSGLPKS